LFKVRITEEEVALAKASATKKEFVTAHYEKFPDYYKEYFGAGVKRADYIWWKKDEIDAKLQKKKHTIVLKTKAIKTTCTGDCRKEDLPDIAVIMVDILNELRIQTKQMDELLALARPKQKVS